MVEGNQTIPVNYACQAPGQKSRGLFKFHLAVSLRGEVKLQDGLPRQFHFGQQQEAVGRLYLQDPPEIQGISHPEFQRMAPAASKPDPPQESVYPAPQPPQIVAEIIAGLSSHPDDGLPDFFGSSLYLDRVAALQNGAAGITGISTVGPFRGNGAAGIHPTGVDLLLLHPFQRQPDGLAAIQAALGE